MRGTYKRSCWKLLSTFPSRMHWSILHTPHMGREGMFYLTTHSTHFIYSYMVKDHSDSERGNPLPPHRLLFLISSKGSFICSFTLASMSPPTPPPPFPLYKPCQDKQQNEYSFEIFYFMFEWQPIAAAHLIRLGTAHILNDNLVTNWQCGLDTIPAKLVVSLVE